MYESHQYSYYSKILIAPEDWEKTLFTCPFRTFNIITCPLDYVTCPPCFKGVRWVFLWHGRSFLEVFIDDFSIFGDSFNECLYYIELVLTHCCQKNLTLNWEKWHFMVKNDIMRGHVISNKGIKVDKVKMNLIINLPPLWVKHVRSFLGHANFYKWFIKDFYSETLN